VFKYLVISFVLLTIMSLSAIERDPDWDVIIYPGSTNGYFQVFIDEELAETGDLLGAFVGQECRGTANVVINEGNAVSTMVIQGVSIEMISFLVYDASLGVICDVETTVQSWPGHDIGYPPDLIIIEAESPNFQNLPPVLAFPGDISFFNDEVFDFYVNEHISDFENDNYGISWEGNENVSVMVINPDWEVVNYGSYTQLYGYVILEGDNAALDCEVGIFVNGECRGWDVLTQSGDFSYLDTEVQGTEIEEMQFKLRSADEIIYVGTETMSSNPGGIVGNLTPVNIEFEEEAFEGYLQLSGENWVGEEEIAFYVNDYLNEAVSRAVTVEVLSNNHAPELNLPDSVILEEDTEYEMDFSAYITDPDEDNVTIILDAVPANLEVYIDGYDVTFSPSENWNGLEVVSFSIEDGELRLADSDEIEVIVDPVNDAPVLDVPQTLNWEEDSVYTIDLSDMVYDVEGDAIEFEWETGEELSVTGAAIEWEVVEYSQIMQIYGLVFINGESLSPDDMVGAFVDGECRGVGYRFGTGNYTSFTVFTEIAETMYFMIRDVSEEIIYTIDLEITTIPGGVVGYPPNFLDLGGNAVYVPMSYEITPAENWSGNSFISLTAIDYWEYESEVQMIAIEIEPVNDMPVADFPTEIELIAGESMILDLALYVSDVDSDELTATAENDDLELVVDGLQIDIATEIEMEGAYPLMISVSDGMEFVYGSIDIIVVQVNQAPELSFPEEISFEEDMQYDFYWQDVTNDFEDDALTISWGGLTDILIIEQDSVLIISAAENWNGNEEVIFTVYDGEYQVNGTVNFVISPVNDTPSISVPSLMRFAEDSSHTFDWQELCGDVDGDELSFSVNAQDIISEIIGSECILSADEDWNGNEQVTFIVSDGIERNEASAELWIIIYPVNDAPELALPEEIRFYEDSTTTEDFSIYCTDIDNAELTLEMTSILEHISVEVTGFVAEFSGEANWSGSETVIFSLSDGEYDVTDEITVHVIAVSDLPQLVLPYSFPLSEDVPVNIDFTTYIQNIENYDLLLESAGSEHLTVTITGYNVDIIPAENWSGSEVVGFDLVDIAGEIDVFDDVIVNVAAVNDVPVIELPDSLVFVEDNQLEVDLAEWSDDIEGDILSYSTESIDIICEIDGSMLILSAAADWNGSEIIVISVNDEQRRLSSSDEIEIIVSTVNDAPWLELPESIEMTGGDSYILNIEDFSGDIEEDQLAIEAFSEELDIDVNGLELTINAPLEYWGTAYVEIELSDGAIVVTDSLMVSVIPGQVILSYDLVENWNWLSFNTLPANSAVEDIMAQLVGSARQIKSQYLSSTWWDGWGWQGQLTELEAGKMYLLQMDEAFIDFTVTGIAADAQMPIPLTINWNWIGHLPQENTAVTDVMAPLTGNATQIKSQYLSLTWYDGWGWQGQLAEMEAGFGYKLSMTTADTLIYPEGETARNEQENLNGRWTVTTGFEMNMTLMAEITGFEFSNDMISECAFVDEEGLSHGMGSYLYEVDCWYFTIGSDIEGGNLQLSILLDNGDEINAEEILTFGDNTLLGSPEAPVIFEVVYLGEDNNELAGVTHLRQSYPNPVSFSNNRASVMIPYSIAVDTEVELTIYNSRGQKIRELVRAKELKGDYDKFWDGRDESGHSVSSGIYFYRFETPGYRESKKLLLLR